MAEDKGKEEYRCYLIGNKEILDYIDEQISLERELRFNRIIAKDQEENFNAD